MFERSICFKTHPESSEDIRIEFLNRDSRPDWIVAEKVQELGHDYWKLDYEKAFSLIAPRPNILWIYAFMERISSKQVYYGRYGSREPYDYYRNWHDELSHEEFSFEFAYHVKSLYCSEESEHAFRTSTPVWVVTIRDFEGTVVHKNWTIALNTTEGDLYLSRKDGKPGEHIHFLKYPIDKLTDSVREFIRIRNFRLKRLGQEIPGV